MIALFCGSRDWADRVPIREDICRLPMDSIVIEGGAKGADRIARHEAHDRGLHVATVDAIWETYGRSGGPRRNAAMLLLRPDIVYAYPIIGAAKSGTQDMIAKAQAAGIEVVVRELVTADALSRTEKT